MTVVGGGQQLPCLCDLLQAADEGPEPFSKETVETRGAGRSAAHQKHDRKTLGNNLWSQKVSWMCKMLNILPDAGERAQCK